jgi:hypothetical protein
VLSYSGTGQRATRGGQKADPNPAQKSPWVPVGPGPRPTSLPPADPCLCSGHPARGDRRPRAVPAATWGAAAAAIAGVGGTTAAGILAGHPAWRAAGDQGRPRGGVTRFRNARPALVTRAQPGWVAKLGEITSVRATTLCALSVMSLPLPIGQWWKQGDTGTLSRVGRGDARGPLLVRSAAEDGPNFFMRGKPRAPAAGVCRRPAVKRGIQLS